MNPVEIVKEYFPDANDAMAKEVLWSCTGWPGAFNTSETKTVEDCLREQLHRISEVSSKNPENAINIAMFELDEAMRKGKEEEIRCVSYFLWENAGRPDSDGVEFWYQAEQLLKN